MNLQTMLLKMGELQETIEAGEAAKRQLSDCLTAIDNACFVSHESVYVTRQSSFPGITPVRDTFFRFNRDFELSVSVFNRHNRPIVEAITIEVDQEHLAGCQAFEESTPRPPDAPALHAHARECYDDAGPGHGITLICNKIAGVDLD